MPWMKIRTCKGKYVLTTVDGQNPAPPRMMIIPLFIGILTIPGGAGFLPSTVLHKSI